MDMKDLGGLFAIGLMAIGTLMMLRPELFLRRRDPETQDQEGRDAE